MVQNSTSRDWRQDLCGSDAVAKKTGFKDVFDTGRIISSLSHFCLSSYILSIKQPIHIYLENMIFKVLYLGCRKEEDKVHHFAL